MKNSVNLMGFLDAMEYTIFKKNLKEAFSIEISKGAQADDLESSLEKG